MNSTPPCEIKPHYDAGNEFYRLWLDPQMVYSAALWTSESQSLEEAQLEKLRFHADAIDARGGMRILDVGCGWGALLRWLVAERSVSEAVGLTLSAAQKQFFDEGPVVDRAHVILASWEDFADPRPFDGIVSVGAFEHFGRYDQSPEQRSAVYVRFFDFCRRRLPRGARLSLQTIAYGRMQKLSPFLRDAIWRESELPFGHEVLNAASRWFEVEQLLNHRMQYARTLRAWQARLASAANCAESIVGRGMVANYLRYLDESAIGFENGGVQLLRIVFRRF